MGIYSATRPVAAPQWEYTLPPDQSQPLNGNILCHQTSRSPSMGIYSASRPVAASLWEYTPPRWTSRSPGDVGIASPPRAQRPNTTDCVDA
eukprot:1180457-Prorocentrum_minimum.AAC.3